MAANTAREKIKSSSDEDKWDPNSAFDRYVKVCNNLRNTYVIHYFSHCKQLKRCLILTEYDNKLLFIIGLKN